MPLWFRARVRTGFMPPHPWFPMRPCSREVLLAVAILASPVVACSDPTGPQSDILAVDRLATAFRLRNVTDRPIYWMAFATESLPLIDILLCTNPTTCRSLAPRAAEVVAPADLPCCTADNRDITVFHYHLVPASGGGFRADSVRSLRVRLWPR
jgi:hypothetical protein